MVVFLLEVEKQKMTEIAPHSTTSMYRVENPNISARPDGITSHEDLVGQWFSPNLNTALGYMRKSTAKSKETGQPVEGTRLVVAQVPSSDLYGYHVSQHPIASHMDVESDNYLIPRDGSVPLEEIALDPIVAELGGQMGDFLKFSEAKQRVIVYLGDLACQAIKFQTSSAMVRQA